MLIEIHKKHVIETTVSNFGRSSFVAEAAAACLRTFCSSSYVGQSDDSWDSEFYGYGLWNVDRSELETLVKKLHNSNESEIVREIMDAEIVYIENWNDDDDDLEFICDYDTLVKFFEELLNDSDKDNETIYFDVYEY